MKTKMKVSVKLLLAFGAASLVVAAAALVALAMG